MDFKNLHVLLLDGSSRQTLPVLSDLHKLGCKITTICESKLDVGYSSRYPHNRFIIPENLYDETTENLIDKEIKSGKYDVIIPLSDLTTQYISKHLGEYLEYIKTFVPEYSVFMKAFDKQQTMEICQRIGVPCTITKAENEPAEQFISKTGYPFVVKPRSGFGSIGFRCIHNENEWKSFLSDADNVDNYVIQEYVNQSGRQFNIHLFMDADNNITFALSTQKCRWFPVDGGASCFCRTVNRPDLVENCTKLLKEIQWRGYCEIEMIEDPESGIVKVIEINGRTSASIKICEVSGINVALNMIELACGENTTIQTKQYRDVRLRCIHTDLLWLLSSKKRFKTNPAWFNFMHNSDQIFDIKDPVPFFTFSIQSLFKYKKEMEKRTR